MKKILKDIILLIIARSADVGTTYMCFRRFENDVAIEGNPISRLLIQNWGFAGLIAMNVLIIGLLILMYGRVKGVRIGWIMNVVAIFSFIFAIFNLFVYVWAI